MNALPAGAVVALLVVGYPLYQLVTTGSLDATSALLRGGVVAGGCALGISTLIKLALSWEAEAEAGRKNRLNSLFTDMESAVAEGTLRDGETAPSGTPGAAPAGPGAP